MGVQVECIKDIQPDKCLACNVDQKLEALRLSAVGSCLSGNSIEVEVCVSCDGPVKKGVKARCGLVSSFVIKDEVEVIPKCGPFYESGVTGEDLIDLALQSMESPDNPLQNS